MPVPEDALQTTALEVSSCISVDDSGARHQGQNGYVNQISNAHFTRFASTFSKNRINFLQFLHAGSITYRMNEHAIDWYTIVALDPGCVLLDVKTGPFDPDQPKELAPWAPKDGFQTA